MDPSSVASIRVVAADCTANGLFPGIGVLLESELDSPTVLSQDLSEDSSPISMIAELVLKSIELRRRADRAASGLYGTVSAKETQDALESWSAYVEETLDRYQSLAVSCRNAAHVKQFLTKRGANLEYMSEGDYPGNVAAANELINTYKHEKVAALIFHRSQSDWTEPCQTMDILTHQSVNTVDVVIDGRPWDIAVLVPTVTDWIVKAVRRLLDQFLRAVSQ